MFAVLLALLLSYMLPKGACYFDLQWSYMSADSPLALSWLYASLSLRAGKPSLLTHILACKSPALFRQFKVG